MKLRNGLTLKAVKKELISILQNSINIAIVTKNITYDSSKIMYLNDSIQTKQKLIEYINSIKSCTYYKEGTKYDI